MGPFARPLPKFRPPEVRVPDILWKDRTFSEGARFLWCLLWLRSDTRVEKVLFTYAALRRLLGIRQSKLIKYIRELQEKGWLICNRLGRYTVELQAGWPLPSKHVIVLPDDILQDRELPHGARWVWGVIQRLGPGFTYEQLVEQTGYCRNSLIKYIHLLQEREWLGAEARRQNRRKVFEGAVKNLLEAKRQEALKAFELSMRARSEWKGYSFGQFLMAGMVELRTDAHVLENGASNYLDNSRTGGRMQIDLTIVEHGVAMEFQGLQHKMPTEHFPGVERLRAQQERDELKRERLRKKGLKLIEVWPDQLSFEHLEAELTAAGVPLKAIPDEMRYVYQTLVQFSADYRAAARRLVQ